MWENVYAAIGTVDGTFLTYICPEIKQSIIWCFTFRFSIHNFGSSAV